MKQRVNLITLGAGDLGRARRYSGVFIDPEGHPWEVAHNPHWTVTESGGIELGR